MLFYFILGGGRVVGGARVVVGVLGTLSTVWNGEGAVVVPGEAAQWWHWPSPVDEDLSFYHRVGFVGARTKTCQLSRCCY